jgi:hypothetical protein
MRMPNTDNQTGCPICGQIMTMDPRYPRAVCPDCAKKTADPAGRSVIFYNESLSGGIGGQYLDDGSLYVGQDCYIDGIKCRATEAHMGGVVIEIC